MFRRIRKTLLVLTIASCATVSGWGCDHFLDFAKILKGLKDCKNGRLWTDFQDLVEGPRSSDVPPAVPFDAA